MKTGIIITDDNAPQENGQEPKGELKRYAVAMCFVRPVENDKGGEWEWRHIIMEVEGENEEGAHWIAEKLATNDAQMPDAGFRLNSTVSMEIK